MVEDGARDAHAAWCSQAFEPGCDIHSVTEDVVALRNYIAKVDADAKLDPLVGRNRGVAVGHTFLHSRRAAHGVYHAGKLCQQTIAGVFDHAASVFQDLRMDQLREMRP